MGVKSVWGSCVKLMSWAYSRTHSVIMAMCLVTTSSRTAAAACLCACLTLRASLDLLVQICIEIISPVLHLPMHYPIAVQSPMHIGIEWVRASSVELKVIRQRLLTRVLLYEHKAYYKPCRLKLELYSLVSLAP